MTSKALGDALQKITYVRHFDNAQSARREHQRRISRSPTPLTTDAAATCIQSRYRAKVQALPLGRTAQAPIRVLPLFGGSAQRDH